MENNKLKSTPKDVFLHLFNILIFYLSIIGFIMLYVQYINVWWPDKLNFYFTNIANIVRIATSIFVIGVPVYLLTSWMLSKDLKANPEKRELSLRKWLIYFTLFISAITIIVDLVIFVYNFLSGELTGRFFFKILVVLVVAAAVFGYYLWELKRKDFKSKIPKLLATLMAVMVIASVVIGIFLIGTPVDQRNRRFDDTRVQALQNLQSQILNYWMQKQSLPEKLNQLEDSISGFVVPTDPDTKNGYEYKIITPLSFELCATFKTSGQDFPPTIKVESMTQPYGSLQQNWDHQAQLTCFTRTIDPELYKPIINNAGNPNIKPAPIAR
ncbi:MAG: DUF5671 domain-containing protein [Candidatus Komeilibacteria bacterium]|nr:DUF5671 domain-containing protein [Candidatus Komeilibacteria bacterium]